MPKSKEYLSTSDSDSEEDYKPKPKKKKEEKAKAKSPKKDSKASTSTTNDNGEVMFQLSRMRFATVCEFRGKKMVNIREYYEKDGDMKPGKKGIALMEDQWKKLKDSIADIDEALDNL